MASSADFGQFTRNYPFIDEPSYDVLVSKFENSAEQRRLVNEQEDNMFTLNFYPLTKTESQDIIDFFKSRNGTYEAFKFTNPLDGKLYDVKFAEKSLPRERVAYDTFRIRVILEILYPYGAYCQVNVNDTIAVSEYNEMFDMALWVNEYESIAVSEYANLFDITVEVGPVYDEVSIIEYIELFDLIIELGIVYESISILENVNALPDELYSDNFDSIGITEYTDIDALLEKLLYDSISIFEYADVFDEIIELSIYDAISLNEDSGLGII